MTSYLRYKQHLAVLDEDDDIESWITVKGNHIPIKKGQTKEEAIENFTKRKNAQKGIEKHTAVLEKHQQEYNKLKEWTQKNQEKFDKLWTNWEDYKNNPEMKDLAMANNILHAQMPAIKKKIDLEQKHIKRYRDMINQLDNTENKITDSGVAKIVSFGKMPLEKAKEAISNLKTLQSKYPFMKGKLDYIGTQDSQEFKKWYKEQVVEWGLSQRYVQIMDSIKDAQKIVEKGLNESNKDDIWSKQRLSWAESVLKQVKELGEEEYARRWVETHFRTTKRFTSRVWAMYENRADNKGGSIIFNSNNYDEHGQNTTDWHPVGCNTPKSVLDHEFGHSIYYNLELDKPFAHSHEEPLGKLRDFLVVEFQGGSKESIRKNLSLYAATNMSEFFAEAFAEYQNNPEPRRIAKTVGEYLEQYKKELEDGTDAKRREDVVNKIIGEHK